jgi:hypothetical protein
VEVGRSSAVMFPESVWLNHSPISVGIAKSANMTPKVFFFVNIKKRRILNPLKKYQENLHEES